MPEWDAEIEVDDGLARRLIRESYPDLDADSLRALGVGWDNTVWVTRDGIAFRFPRREIALAGAAREMRLIPQIAPCLPCAIPDAAYPGSPSASVSVAVVRQPGHLRVRDLRSRPRVVARGRLAGDLGAFLRCLHGLSVPGLDTLPFDPLLALFLGAALALYARAQGMRALEAETLSGLERTLSERS